MTRTTRMHVAEVEVGKAGDTVAEAEEGSVRGITSGGNKYIIT